jgi:pimeloyl-ACP methyl ester carboxylesterase
MTAPVAWKRRGRGPAVVFLHGIGGGAESFDAQLRAFGPGWLAAAWDMPGYGASPPCDVPGFDAWSQALADGLDDLGVADCVLVGHSIGGMVAQTFVARHPGRVRALVLSATSPAFGNPDGDFQRDFIASRLGPLARGATMATLAADFVPGLVGRAAPPAALEAARATMARVPPETYRAAMEALVRFDARASLPSIACPTLLLAGEDDSSAPPRVMERMAAKIAGAEFICIPGMGHLGNLEQPEAFNAAIARFLQSRASGS